MDNKDIIVVKLGGETLVTDDYLIDDIVFLQKNGFNLVIIHGGGKEINRWLRNLNIIPVFENGLRVTDERTLEIATAVLCGIVNKRFVSSLIRKGGRAVGISGVDGCLVQSTIENEKLGFTGEEVEINDELLICLLRSNFIPVIAPISINKDVKYDNVTKLINVNGDTVAAGIASKLNAVKLIFLTDVPGLYDQNNELISEISSNEVLNLIEQGFVSGGMAVKVKSCISVLNKIKITRIIDGRVPHALVNEVYEKGKGTTIVGRK